MKAYKGTVVVYYDASYRSPTTHIVVVNAGNKTSAARRLVSVHPPQVYRYTRSKKNVITLQSFEEIGEFLSR